MERFLTVEVKNPVLFGPIQQWLQTFMPLKIKLFLAQNYTYFKIFNVTIFFVQIFLKYVKVLLFIKND